LEGFGRVGGARIRSGQRTCCSALTTLWRKCVHSAVWVRFYRHTISQKPMQLGSPKVIQKCSMTMTSPGNRFILGSKGQT